MISVSIQTQSKPISNPRASPPVTAEVPLAATTSTLETSESSVASIKSDAITPEIINILTAEGNRRLRPKIPVLMRGLTG